MTKQYNKTCTICGKTFETGSHSAKLCSKECINARKRELYREKYAPLNTVIKCEVCGKWDTPIRADSRVCSKECIEERKRQKKQKFEKRACEYCGTVYNPAVAHQKFCSKFCGRLSDNERTRMKRSQPETSTQDRGEDAPEVTTCRRCGGEYYPNGSGYCSVECRALGAGEMSGGAQRLSETEQCARAYERDPVLRNFMVGIARKHNIYHWEAARRAMVA